MIPHSLKNIREVDSAAEHCDPVLRYGYRHRMTPDPFIERQQADLARADHVVIVAPI